MGDASPPRIIKLIRRFWDNTFWAAYRIMERVQKLINRFGLLC